MNGLPGVGGGFNKPAPTPHPDATQVKQAIERNRQDLGVLSETSGKVQLQIRGGKVEIRFVEGSGWQKDSKTDRATKQAILDNLPKVLPKGIRNGTINIQFVPGEKARVS